MDNKLARDLYEKMYAIRRFEESVEELFANGELPGFIHLYIGQEANAVGVCANLHADDYITSTHRGHGHCIAKGAKLDRLMAELMGKKTGYNKGKGGSMHMACTEVGMLGANGITAGGIPHAVGAALTAKMKKNGRVAVAFFGDGASNQGTFHESVNLAATFHLPVLFVCENNQYGVGSNIKDVTNNPNIAERAKGYNIPGSSVDGQNVVEVYEASRQAVQHAREGKGPVLLELKTWRYRGHFQGEPATYRDRETEQEWLKKDPLLIAKRLFAERSLLTDAEIVEVEKAVEAEIAAAITYGRASPLPAPEDALTDVYCS